MGSDSSSLPIVGLAEAQAFARVESGEEEALIAGFIRTASGLCEAFLNQVVIARDVSIDLPASGEWERIPATPIRSIDNVAAIATDGTAIVLPADAYAIDVDSSGDGWVRIANPGETRRVRVTANAGMTTNQNGVPEPIRQGVLRLVAHLLAARDGDGEALPAAVTALWRPYRRMRMR